MHNTVNNRGVFRLIKSTILILFFSIIFIGCGSGSSNPSGTDTSYHFQGRDCLSCHNVDLQENSHLTIGGTIYKNSDVNNSDDLDQVCETSMKILLTDTLDNVIIDSSQTQAKNSPGLLGKGNFFILKKDIPSITGRYIVKIVNEQNKLITSSLVHSFKSEFNESNPTDSSNRYSCNSCHNNPAKGGAPGRLYAYNNSLCK